jgi:hypothetical protein
VSGLHCCISVMAAIADVELALAANES